MDVRERREMLASIKRAANVRSTSSAAPAPLPAYVQNWLEAKKREEQVSEHDRQMAIRAAEKQRRRMEYNAKKDAA